MQQNKKGQTTMNLNVLPVAALSIVVFILMVAVGTLIIAGMNESAFDETVNSSAGEVQSAQTALDVLSDGNSGMSDLAGWTSTLVVIVVAGVVLSIILGLFVVRSRGGGRV